MIRQFFEHNIDKFIPIERLLKNNPKLNLLLANIYLFNYVSIHEELSGLRFVISGKPHEFVPRVLRHTSANWLFGASPLGALLHLCSKVEPNYIGLHIPQYLPELYLFLEKLDYIDSDALANSYKDIYPKNSCFEVKILPYNSLDKFISSDESFDLFVEVNYYIYKYLKQTGFVECVESLSSLGKEFVTLVNTK